MPLLILFLAAHLLLGYFFCIWIARKAAINLSGSRILATSLLTSAISIPATIALFALTPGLNNLPGSFMEGALVVTFPLFLLVFTLVYYVVAKKLLRFIAKAHSKGEESECEVEDPEEVFDSEGVVVNKAPEVSIDEQSQELADKRWFKSKPVIGVSLGVVYGLLLRVVFEEGQFSGLLEIISTSFLVFAPISVGAVAVYFSRSEIMSGISNDIKVASEAIFFFLLTMFALLLEGLICLVLVAPVFWVAAVIGGVLMGVVLKHTDKGSSAITCIAILPLAIGGFESQLPAKSSDWRVQNTIQINASAEEIFDTLHTVKRIEKDELGFSFMHIVGLPRPVEASMDATGVGAVRISRWEKDVEFQERITVWERASKMHYEFIIPKGSIPREALDRHVELGGDYFTVVSGGYDIKCASETDCTLILHTVFRNTSHLELYGNTWAKLVLSDFHRSILGLMKRRAEKV